MHQIEDRNTITVEARRSHLVSQWPLIAHDWMWERHTERDRSGKIKWQSIARLWSRAIALTVLLSLVVVGPLLAVIIFEDYISMLPNRIVIPVLAVLVVCVLSFSFSVAENKRIGVFWLIGKLEGASRARKN